MNIFKHISVKALFFLMITQLLLFQALPVARAEGPQPPNQNPGPVPATHSAIISNGTLQLGVKDEGELNVAGGTLSTGPDGSTVVGLRYLPTNADALSPGCLCEGWGAADALSGTSGYADISTDGGARNMTLVSFTSTASTATSVVNIQNVMQVTHAYHPSAQSANLYQVDVTIKNISSSQIDLRYRRVMDWDISPTTFNEYVTIQGTSTSPDVLYASDDGFETANALGPRDSLGSTGDFVDAGPADHGALFDFELGSLAVGQSKQFTLFYGATGNEADAMAALQLVGAEVYSLGEPATDATTGQPNTFIFAYKPARNPNPTITEIIQALIQDVQGLIDDGTLNKGQGNALLSKLNLAAHKLDGGDFHASCNQLDAFVNQVNAFMNAGILSQADGQALIDAEGWHNPCVVASDPRIVLPVQVVWDNNDQPVLVFSGFTHDQQNTLDDVLNAIAARIGGYGNFLNYVKTAAGVGGKQYVLYISRGNGNAAHYEFTDASLTLSQEIFNSTSDATDKTRSYLPAAWQTQEIFIRTTIMHETMHLLQTAAPSMITSFDNGDYNIPGTNIYDYTTDKVFYPGAVFPAGDIRSMNDPVLYQGKGYEVQAQALALLIQYDSDSQYTSSDPHDIAATLSNGPSYWPTLAAHIRPTVMDCMQKILVALSQPGGTPPAVCVQVP